MSKILLIAEKPDQARTFYVPLLEKVSRETFTKRDGYYESKSYFITWFFGHLLEQLKPDEYNDLYSQWRIEDLPIIPEKMLYKFKGASQKAQGQLVNSLCKQSDTIICGTDPDREGQGIFDTFIKYYSIQKPMLRLWATSLTDADLRKAWDTMKAIDKYNMLSAARDLRADSDWLVGMNASRAYSIVAKGSLPIGRVLTATLAIIVKRDLEVENYKESFFYQLKGTWCDGIGFTYFDDTGSKFENRQTLEKILEVCVSTPFLLSGFKSEIKIENPPKTFNLPDLQKEANKRFGFSLDKTLQLAQSLYEKKLTTYPRTDSSYLPESDFAEYHALIRKVATQEELSLLKSEGESVPSVKNTDSPHTALVVTGEKGPMNPDEQKLYELIRSRFVGAFMVPRRYEQYDLEIRNASGHKFKATIRKEIDEGFRKLYKEQDREEDVQDVKSSIHENEFRKKNEMLRNLNIEQKKKAKPKYYTPATLITAMQTCGRQIENEDARKILSETKGIGTPATQAIYPQQLQKYEYIVEQKGCFISTQKGRLLIREISPDLKTPELTAEWEMKLKMIESGKLSPHTYRKELNEYIHKIIDNAKSRIGKIDLAAGEKTAIQCPICKKEIVRKNWGYSCISKECGFSVSSKIAEKVIPEKEIERLLLNGETGLIKGFKSNGKKFEAKLVLKEKDGKISVAFEFENINCPKCKKGSIRIFEWGAGCSERETCGFRVWRTIAEKKLSDSQIKKLVTEGKTGILKDFKSKKTGKKFNAELILKDFEVIFNFK